MPLLWFTRYSDSLSLLSLLSLSSFCLSSLCVLLHVDSLWAGWAFSFCLLSLTSPSLNPSHFGKCIKWSPNSLLCFDKNLSYWWIINSCLSPKSSFMHDFSKILSLLTLLARKSSSFMWNKMCKVIWWYIVIPSRRGCSVGRYIKRSSLEWFLNNRMHPLSIYFRNKYRKLYILGINIENKMFGLYCRRYKYFSTNQMVEVFRSVL